MIRSILCCSPNQWSAFAFQTQYITRSCFIAANISCGGEFGGADRERFQVYICWDLAIWKSVRDDINLFALYDDQLKIHSESLYDLSWTSWRNACNWQKRSISAAIAHWKIRWPSSFSSHLTSPLFWCSCWLMHPWICLCPSSVSVSALGAFVFLLCPWPMEFRAVTATVFLFSACL